jgi:AraC family ethanolamine operon transcriptional activator
VRRELKNPASPYRTVQDVAAAWGFWHMGQFSADYRRLFCEHPSEALRSRFQ